MLIFRLSTKLSGVTNDIPQPGLLKCMEQILDITNPRYNMWSSCLEVCEAGVTRMYDDKLPCHDAWRRQVPLEEVYLYVIYYIYMFH